MPTDPSSYAHLIANDSRTPTPMLWRLVHLQPDRQVILALSRNPQCPDDLLEHLRQQFSDHLPAAQESPEPLPDFLSPEDFFTLANSVHASTRSDVARHPDCPAEVLFLLANDFIPGVRVAVAQHPAVDGGVLRPFVFHQNPVMRSAAARNPVLPAEWLHELIKDPHHEVREAVASRSDLAFEDFARLAEDRDFEVRDQVARNPLTPMEVLQGLVHDPKELVRISLARHPTLGKTLLHELARDEAPMVRRQVAWHPHCPLDVLEALSEDEDVPVRCGVAAHRRCKKDLLSKLLVDPDPWVQFAAATNRNASPQQRSGTLQRLVEEHFDETELMYSLTELPDLPGHLLKQLVFHPGEYECQVGLLALDHPNLTEGDLREILPRLMTPPFHNHRILDLPIIGVEELAQMYRHPELRPGVIRHPLCPVPLLDVYRNKPQHTRAVIENPHCPPEILHELLQDEDWNYWVLFAPNLPVEWRLAEYEKRLQEWESAGRIPGNSQRD